MTSLDLKNKNIRAYFRPDRKISVELVHIGSIIDLNLSAIALHRLIAIQTSRVKGMDPVFLQNLREHVSLYQSNRSLRNLVW
jgi:hypothetical protein